MRINTQTAYSQNAKAVILPLVQNDSLTKDLAVIAVACGIAPELLMNDFKAKANSIQVIYPSTTSKKIILLGLGKKIRFADAQHTFRSFIHQHKKSLPAHIAINFMLSNVEKADYTMLAEAALGGIIMGKYNIALYKTEEKEKTPFEKNGGQVDVIVPPSMQATIQTYAERGKAIAKSRLRIMDLMNAPANRATPKRLADWAVQSGKEHGYKVTVFDKEKIEDVGLYALLAVNRGSELPPRFIIMEYVPKNTDVEVNLPKIGLVGKGITFDTGGYSIKTRGMEYMKSDMGGAAAVLGTMEAAARLQLPVHLIGIVPSTDNMVDATAIRPSDVIDSYSGKTIEVTDTDAEGRLILADGLAYMERHFSPDVMIDLATLTGSAVRALGYQAAALFSNDDALAQQLSQVGEQTGERVWRMPLWDAYAKDVHSDIADSRNYSGRPVAGAISAAKFLELFINEHPKWAHLDIAGVAFGSNAFSKQKSATGYGVRLLVDYLAGLTS